MKYLSIDLETTGLEPRRNCIIEFGAIFDDTEKPEVPISELPVFHCYLSPPEGGYIGSPQALAMNGKIFQIIADKIKNGEHVHHTSYFPDCLMDCHNVGPAFKKWTKELGFDPKRGITGAGKNFGTFDLQFINYWLGGMPRFHHRVLDPAMFFMSASDAEIPNTFTCMERAKIPGQVEHTALADAAVVVQLVRKGLAFCGVKL